MDILPFTNRDDDGTSSLDGKPDTIPAHVWQTLQDSGAMAAQRLSDLLHGKAFERLKVGDQTRLIQLALDRAYGPPIKREMSLQLSGTVSDAVAESLGRLASTDLPEMRGKGASQPARNPMPTKSKSPT